jgi:hypothetical protein
LSVRSRGGLKRWTWRGACWCSAPSPGLASIASSRDTSPSSAADGAGGARLRETNKRRLNVSIKELSERERYNLGNDCASIIHDAHMRYWQDLKSYNEGKSSRCPEYWWRACMPSILTFLRLRGVEPDGLPYLKSHLWERGLWGPFYTHQEEQEPEEPHKLHCWGVCDNNGDWVDGNFTRADAHRLAWALMWLWAVSFGADGCGQK